MPTGRTHLAQDFGTVPILGISAYLKVKLMLYGAQRKRTKNKNKNKTKQKK